jgi:hypothetical protein
VLPPVLRPRLTLPWEPIQQPLECHLRDYLRRLFHLSLVLLLCFGFTFGHVLFQMDQFANDVWDQLKRFSWLANDSSVAF